MKKKTPQAIVVRNLRTVGVGGTLGAAAAVALYFTVPAVGRAGISLDALTALGVAVGGAVHHAMLPVLAILAHYRRMLELVLARRVGWMTDESTQWMMQVIQERYFLGSVTVRAAVRKGSEKVRNGCKVQDVQKKVRASDKVRRAKPNDRQPSTQKASSEHLTGHTSTKVRAA
jgi:hypothetical protein